MHWLGLAMLPHHQGGLLHVPDQDVRDGVLVAVLPGKMAEELPLLLVFILLILGARLSKISILQFSFVSFQPQNLDHMSRPNMEVIRWVPPSHLLSKEDLHALKANLDLLQVESPMGIKVENEAKEESAFLNPIIKNLPVNFWNQSNQLIVIVHPEQSSNLDSSKVPEGIESKRLKKNTFEVILSCIIGWFE